ncbi:hypothetical protein E4U42_003025, partial [Claviceps africana]
MPTSWTDWSDWSMDHSQNLLYRVRQDQQGNLDYEYNHDHQMHAETPRGGPLTMEALTAQLEGLSPGSSFDDQVQMPWMRNATLNQDILSQKQNTPMQRAVVESDQMQCDISPAEAGDPPSTTYPAHDY